MEFEPRDQFEQRQKKIEQIQALGHDPYPREFRWTDTPAALVEKFGSATGPELEASKREVRVAGRIVSIRLMGKAGFAHLQGAGKRIQIYVKKDAVGDSGFQLFHLLDLGDSIGVRGHLFRTKTNELSIWVDEIFFLAKALLPLPEKWHGLTDVELRYRQRYLDLIANEKSRQVFVTRARIIQELRRFFDARGYIEVETPMMHPIPGGAAARPFVTHHNTLDINLYLRVAPELYLKRLTVGGFDRVYEINRNFRNEGISTQHNPEFTMLEFYEAYSNYRDLMDMNEKLFALLAKSITGSTTVKYGDAELDFSKMQRLSMREAIVKYWPREAGEAPRLETLVSSGGARDVTSRYNAWAKKSGAPYAAEDPSLTERFEIYVAGMEVANGFSELNDPAEQERRFLAQIAQGGEEMPKQLDVDYIRALCHGMPPTAGEGIGIDRLTMVLTDSPSIRDVILFPLLRPEGGGESSSTSEAHGA